MTAWWRSNAPALQISGRPALAGNSLTLLQNGDEAYPQMVAAIDAARTSILLSSYIFRDDEAGAPFIDAIIRGKGRGVEARVLLDGIGSGYFVSPAYHRLRQAGVPAARFMHSPKPWLMPFLNLRSHKKILVVDGRAAFIGGLNIGAENLLASAPRSPVRDVHFAVHGPIIDQLARDFARDWLFTTDEPLEDAAWFPTPEPVPAPVNGAAFARVVTSGPDRDLDKIQLLALTRDNLRARQRADHVALLPARRPADLRAVARRAARGRGRHRHSRAQQPPAR